ncbi:hypothetical protein IG631_24343, partial [Alternaria alternata]
RCSVRHGGVVLDAQHPTTAFSTTVTEHINITATSTMDILPQIFKNLCNLRHFSHYNTGGASKNSGTKSTPMTSSDASRIQSSQALGGKDMSSGGFAARAQSAGTKNANEAGTGKK